MTLRRRRALWFVVGFVIIVALTGCAAPPERVEILAPAGTMIGAPIGGHLTVTLPGQEPRRGTLIRFGKPTRVIVELQEPKREPK